MLQQNIYPDPNPSPCLIFLQEIPPHYPHPKIGRLTLTKKERNTPQNICKNVYRTGNNATALKKARSTEQAGW